MMDTDGNGVVSTNEVLCAIAMMAVDENDGWKNKRILTLPPPPVIQESRAHSVIERSALRERG